MEYREPMPEIIVEIDGKKYGYDYGRMSFLQVMYAEERSMLKQNRLDFVRDNPGMATEALIDPEYRLDMSGILFVPIVDEVWKPFNADIRSAVTMAFAKADRAAYEKLEAASEDFFCARGKRSVASSVLLKQGGLKEFFRMQQKIQALLMQFSARTDSANVANSDAE